MAAQKVVLVTGCSSGGIGFSLCEQFAQRGCKVYATARNVKSIEGFSDTAATSIEKLTLDVTSDDDVQRVVAHVVEAEGRIDVVVNNAGVLAIGPLVDLTSEQIQRTFETNTFSVLRVARAVVPHMAKHKSGLIVNIGSVVADIPSPWNGLYSASKSALHTLSEVLSMECRPFNIDVMLVAPGAVSSNIARNQAASFHLPTDSLYGEYLENIMARMWASQSRYAMPNEVFARKVVAKALQRKPPGYIMLGGGSFVFAVAKWFPRSWVLNIAWRIFSRKK